MNERLSMFDDHWQPLRSKTTTFYVLVENKGEWYFLWKPHMDYDHLVKVSAKGRKKPFRWKTAKGATKHAAARYSDHEWKVELFDEDKWHDDRP
jgi:hypothetical protein